MEVVSDTRRRVPAGEEQPAREVIRPFPRRARVGATWLALAVGGAIAVGLVLRFSSRSDLWSDEALAVNIARLPLHDLGHALRQDGAPPLYYVLLHVWMRVFGTSNFVARALSGVFAVAALPAAWYAGRRLDVRRARAGAHPGNSPAEGLVEGPVADAVDDPGDDLGDDAVDGMAGGHPVAWATLLLLASSPFAVRYATEARMYSFMLLLAFLGYLALARALEQSSLMRLAAVAVVTALLLYTHYWGFAVVGVVGAWLAFEAWRGERARTARRSLAAIAAGVLLFVPWVPTFLFQLQHTGTPWAGRVLPTAGAAKVLHDFGGGFRPLVYSLTLIALLALFARAVDTRHIDLDLLTRPGVRGEALLATASLAAALGLSYLGHTAVEGRYAAVVFPLFLLVVAFGLMAFASRPVRCVVLAALVVTGVAGGVRDVREKRTQARQSAARIAHDARPGDVVAFCPDFIAPDVSRLLPGGLRQITFPEGPGPGLVNWIDHAERTQQEGPRIFARRVLSSAGNHDVWFVWTHGVRELRHKCEEIGAALAAERKGSQPLVEPDSDFFENQGLVRYPKG